MSTMGTLSTMLVPARAVPMFTVGNGLALADPVEEAVEVDACVAVIVDGAAEIMVASALLVLVVVSVFDAVKPGCVLKLDVVELSVSDTIGLVGEVDELDDALLLVAEDADRESAAVLEPEVSLADLGNVPESEVDDSNVLDEVVLKKADVNVLDMVTDIVGEPPICIVVVSSGSPKLDVVINAVNVVMDVVTVSASDMVGVILITVEVVLVSDKSAAEDVVSDV